MRVLTVDDDARQGFHLVNQQESRSIQEDSTSMKIIATMTFIFLPITTVGTICGSQFLRYDVNDDGKEVFSVSRHFWIFWLSALTVTGASFGLWKVGYRSAFRKLRRRRVVEDVEVAADVIAKV